LTRAYIGLGANLGDRERTMRRALELLGDGVVAVGLGCKLCDTEPM